jgi:hypothetical protein
VNRTGDDGSAMQLLARALGALPVMRAPSAIFRRIVAIM